MKPIYLDYNASTPIDPAVHAAMLPYLDEQFGNPSSTHVWGREAKAAVERARAQVAELIGAATHEIIFTAGGTEATNQAIKGVVLLRLVGGSRWTSALRALLRRETQVIISAIEHPATTEVCSYLARFGARVTVLPVDATGRVDVQAIERALRQPTALVSIMHANNEVGTVQPLAEIGKLCRAARVPLHADAAQSLGKMPVRVDDLGVDLLTIAGHKVYAPKGIGALYVRSGLALEPFLHGAGQEQGRRAGTENVAYIVGLGVACEVARQSLPTATTRLAALRERLWQRLHAGLGAGVVQNGHPTERLPNTLHVSFLGHIGSELLAAVPDLAASTGSACHEGKVTRSAVLCAMSLPLDVNHGAIRLSVGRYTTEDEVDRAADMLIAAARRKEPSAVETANGSL